MNTSLGYSKKTLTNSNVLLSGGGDKALSEFIGSLNWDSTNKKLQYKSASSTDFTDLITFGSNAFTSYSGYDIVFLNNVGTTVDTFKALTSPSKTFKAGTNVQMTAASNVITITATDTWNANAVGVAGYVAAPTKADNANMTWLTDAEGVPAWRASNNHTHDYIKAKSAYAFTSSDLPNTFNLGVSAGFVNYNSGFGSYGSVLTVRTSFGGGGTLQLYAPYSNTYGGDHLKARFGDFGTDSGNSWTTLKTIAWLDDIPTKSSWNYDDMYVSSLTTSGNYLKWIKNGSNNYITIPYATNADSATTIHYLFYKASEEETASGYYKIATITHNGWANCSFTMLVNNSYSGIMCNTLFDFRCSSNSTTLKNYAFNIIGGTDLSSRLKYLITKDGDDITKIELFMLCTRYEHPHFFLIAQKASSIMALNTTDWGATPDMASGTTMTGSAVNTIVASALTSTSIGSATLPVYFDADGKPVVCTSYANASVDYATSAGSATNVTGVVAIANGGTGASTRLNALKNLTNENVSTNAEYFLTITSSWGKGGYTSVAQAKTVLAMTGATNTAAGIAGVVPAPPSNGYDTKFLRADGTWSIPAYPTKASWNYDDVYVKSVSISGNSLRINKNGTNDDLTIPYASKAALDSNGRSLVTYKEYSETFPPNDGTLQWYTLLTYTNSYYTQSAIIEINTRKATATILINFYNANSPYITFLGYYGSPNTVGGGFTGGVRVIADGNNAIIQFQFLASTESSSGYRQLGVKVYSEIPARWALVDSLVADTATYESFLANVKATSKCLTGGGLMPTANNTYNIGSSSSVYKHVYATIFHGALDGNASSATKLNDDNLTLWGQSFNGTANVSGNMTDVGTVSANGNYVITKTSGETKFAVVNNNGSVELITATNRGVYDRTNTKWLIGTNGTNSWMACGNVAIASAVNTTYKLYVDGTIGATGNTTLGGTLDVTGTTTLSSYLTVAGNLGVGTTSPSYALDVVGSARTKLMYFYNRANTANAGYIGAGSSYVDYIYFQAYTNNGLYMGANNGFDLVILPDHNVGVGTTEPSYKMHVNGNVGASNFYTTSDRSKKLNISSFSEHISKFQLKDTEKWHYGVIAQEVPEMFRDGKEGNMTVNYNSVLSYYVGCLENRVKELEDKLAKYEELKNK